MDPKLLLITKSGSVNALYSLLQKDPCILQNVDVIPFIHTPLHEASLTGKINLAMELMILKPSFSKKLNTDGFSPLHLAVQNQHVELAQKFIKFDPSLVRIRGRGGMTPLHLVAQKGDADLLTEFLLLCPDSIKDGNVNGETVLNITVINNRYQELKVLTGWMQRMRTSDALSTEIHHILNRCDREGNRALHLAAYKNDHQTIKQLLKCMSLNRNIQNKNGMTALDALRANGPHMVINAARLIQKAGGKSGDSISKFKKASVFLRKSVTFKEYCSTGMARYRSRMSDGTRNALLVITALIITTTYQTAVQLENTDNLEVLSRTHENQTDTYSSGFENPREPLQIILKIFLLWGLNTVAFLLAIALTFILLPVGKAYMWWYIYISIPLVCSYGTSLYLKYVKPEIFLSIYVMGAFGVMAYLLILYVKWKLLVTSYNNVYIMRGYNDAHIMC